MNIVTHTSQVLELRKWESPMSFLTKPILVMLTILYSLVLLILGLLLIFSLHHLIGYIFGSLMIFGSVVMFSGIWIGGSISQITFDKDLALVKITTNSMTGATEHLSWNLEQIKEISVKQFSYRYGIYYELQLELNNSRPSAIGILRSTSTAQMDTFATTISEFLDLPIV